MNRNKICLNQMYTIGWQWKMTNWAELSAENRYMTKSIMSKWKRKNEMGHIFRRGNIADFTGNRQNDCRQRFHNEIDNTRQWKSALFNSLQRRPVNRHQDFMLFRTQYFKNWQNLQLVWLARYCIKLQADINRYGHHTRTAKISSL